MVGIQAAGALWPGQRDAMPMTAADDPARTAFVLVDPYNDFFADDGKIYPRLREVAEAVGLRQHIRELLASSSASTASSTSSWPA